MLAIVLLIIATVAVIVSSITLYAVCASTAQSENSAQAEQPLNLPMPTPIDEIRERDRQRLSRLGMVDPAP